MTLIFLSNLHTSVRTSIPKILSRAMVKFHNGADAAMIRQPPTQTRLRKHCHSVQIFDHQRFQVETVSSLPPTILNTRRQAVFSDETALQDWENRTKLNPRKPVKKRDCHQDESFSPASSLYLDFEVLWVRSGQPGAWEGPLHFTLLPWSVTQSTTGPHPEFFHQDAGDPTFRLLSWHLTQSGSGLFQFLWSEFQQI